MLLSSKSLLKNEKKDYVKNMVTQIYLICKVLFDF